jgi:hypothetical protein
MRTFVQAVFWLPLLAGLLLASARGEMPRAEMPRAETPPYLVLARPQATPLRTPYYPAVKVLAQPYPYGYFGACGVTHWQRQFGIHRTYTQWSQK